MPDLYVDSGSGSDTTGGGDSGAPLRTLTFAVAEAARRFGPARTTVHLAAGTYSPGTGEVYPIEIPQNVSVIGAGRRRTTILYQRSGLSMFERALAGGEELAHFTLLSEPFDRSACYTSVGIWQSVGATFIHDIVIDIASDAGDEEVAFGAGLALENDARVTRVEVSRCFTGAGYASPAGVEITASTFRDNRDGIVAVGVGEVRDCDLVGNHHGVVCRGTAGTLIENNRFTSNYFGIDAKVDVHARGNEMDDPLYGIVCHDGGLIEDNVIRVGRGGFGMLAGLVGWPFRRGAARRSGVPVVRNNEFVRTGPAGGRQFALAAFGEGSTAIVEGNRFRSEAGFGFAVVDVVHDAVPDLGGGAGGSTGGNRFETGWFVFVQDSESPRKEIFAQNNAWSRLPVAQGSGIYGPGSWYIDGGPRDAIVFRTEGASPVGS